MTRYYNHNLNNVSYYDYIRHLTIPIHIFFFLLVLLLFIFITSFISYESKIESFMQTLKLYLMLTPVVILLVVHLLSKSSSGRNWLPASLVPMPEKDALHRAGGSPWGVATALVVLIFMVSYQSSVHELWFPLSRRR